MVLTISKVQVSITSGIKNICNETAYSGVHVDLDWWRISVDWCYQAITLSNDEQNFLVNAVSLQNSSNIANDVIWSTQGFMELLIYRLSKRLWSSAPQNNGRLPLTHVFV